MPILSGHLCRASLDAGLRLGLSLLLCGGVAVAQEGNEELIEAFRYAPAMQVTGLDVLSSVELPVVGCPQDGQVGLVRPPRTPATTRVLLPTRAASELAFYTTSSEPLKGTLGPRGWTCHGLIGSDGSVLYVTPPGATGDPQEPGFKGPFIRRRVAEGGTSGRFEVARVAGRIFPQARGLVEEVQTEGLDEPGTYAFEPWPNDTILRLSDRVVAYATPGGVRGLGQGGSPPYGSEPTSGIVVYDKTTDGFPYLVQLDVRLGDSQTLLYPAIAIAFLDRLRLSDPPPDVRTVARAMRPMQDPVALARSFYEALGRGDGRAAARFVSPERRASGPFSAEAMTRFYSSLAEPLRLVDVQAAGSSEVEVRYRYRKPSGSPCDGRSVVTFSDLANERFIARIKPLSGC